MEKYTLFCLILSVFLLCACSELEYINLKDTTEENWKHYASKDSTGTPISSPRIIETASEGQKEKKISQESFPQPYKTPLAGSSWDFNMEEGEVQVLPVLPIDLDIDEREVAISARDRSTVAALNLGTSIVFPNVGGDTFVPFGAFFYKTQSADSSQRFQAILAGVANFVDYADGSWNDSGWEAVFHAENVTIPVGQTETIEGNRANFTEIETGHTSGGIGLGWYTPVAPYHVDSYFSVQLLYELEYLYSSGEDETGDDVILPPDTFVHRLHLRFRWDSLDRNFIELPHKGWAFGGDVILAWRDRWRDHQFSDVFVFDKDDTKDYFKTSAYFVGALAIPNFSERHRVIITGHAGWMPAQNWDRFSALRVGGGPPGGETNSLYRPIFPGALFNQFIAEKYLVFSAEYRFEFNFFLFLHVRATWILGEFGFLKLNQLDTEDYGSALSVGVTSGFLWDSLLYFEYSLDDGFIRQGESGSSVLVSVSKSF